MFNAAPRPDAVSNPAGSPDVRYKLVYFNSRGTAELARLLFAFTGTDYTDERIAKEDWPARKPEMPQQVLPVLFVNGKPYCQSDAINRYLARKLGLYGKTDEEAFEIDEICETVNDMGKKLMTILFNSELTDHEKSEGARGAVETDFLRFRTFLVKRLNENHAGFFVGNEATLADIAFYRIVHALKEQLNAFDGFESQLQDHYNKIASHPNIAKWVQNRPVTNM